MARAQQGPEQRRVRILRATVTVLRERGFAGARVADIAAEAGTSSGLVLYHFGSLAGALAEALTYLEDTFYADLDAELDGVAGAVDRLRRLAELAAGSGPAVGDWTLWLEIWVRALRDESAARARESLDQRWRSLLRSLVEEGRREGVFRPSDVEATTLRLASLMDGLAIQLALKDASMTVERFQRLWLDAASLELDVPGPVLRPRRTRRPARVTAS